MKKTDLRSAILKQLMQNGETTRPELVELTGIRAATVFEAVDALKREGFVEEPARTGKRTGRRAPKRRN